MHYFRNKIGNCNYLTLLTTVLYKDTEVSLGFIIPSPFKLLKEKPLVYVKCQLWWYSTVALTAEIFLFFPCSALANSKLKRKRISQQAEAQYIRSFSLRHRAY